MSITLMVNGEERVVEADADTPLLWAIRDNLELTGTKFGCGMAMCGACTVHLDGEPVRSCVTPIGDVGEQAVTTIEGLASREGTAIQAAWRELDVVQCGYCQSGQILQASALLKENSRPSDQDIDEAMSGNVCRCATYHRIRAAIHRAADILGG